MKTTVKRAVSGVFLVLFLLSGGLFPVSGAAAETDAARKVRVGWYNSDHFQEGSGDGEWKSGYSYEYLQSVSSYTGWEYEYVYGGWSDLYETFVNGGIDLLAGVSYTEERAPLMNYPGYEMGFEAYYIYKKAGDDSILGSDLATLRGKRVGTLVNNLMTDFFETWMASSGADCVEVLFDDFSARDAALEAGDIDAFIAVNNNVPANSGFAPVVMVGNSSYYLAVTKDRTDLLDALNKALTSINESNPYFTESLQIKYFQNTAVNAALSPEEGAWVRDHGRIRVGYLEAYLPFCGLDEDGNAGGVITDIFQEWEEQLNLRDQLKVEYVPYTRYSELTDALQAGDIDAAFPIYDSIWISEQEGIVQTNNLVSSTIYMIYKGEFSGDTTQVIALSDQSAFQRNYVAANYPASQLYPADTLEACLDAVKQGKATCTFFNSGQAEPYLSRNEYEKLNRLSLGEPVNYCIGVRKGNNVVYSLLERGISLIDKSAMTNAMYAYSSVGVSYSVADFIQDNVLLVLSVTLIFIALILAVAVMLAVSLRRTKEQARREEEMLRVTTEQKEDLEAARNHLQEAVRLAEQANRAKTAFLFNMSHDIRTPMNAILGFADLAEKRQNEPALVRDYLYKIRSSGDVLLSILNNVLEMSQIEKGAVKLEETVCGVEQFYDRIFTVFEAQMREKGIQFPRSLSLRHRDFYCDPAKLSEIFLNILSNAWKYTESGGTVEMRVEELPAGEDTALLRTAIRDTGRGMSPEFLSHIFDEFARERISEKNNIEGTGLGMSIVKRLTDLMGGSVHVESTPGEGTVVTVEIPHRAAVREEPAETSDDEGSEDPFEGKRILLAEDNDINAEIVSEILTSVGLSVERAEDGQICLDMVKEKPAGYYDLILMDIQMPNMNGYEASRAVRALHEPGKSDLPIFALTANTSEEDRRNAVEAGMNRHLGKPIDVEGLLKTLSETFHAA